MYPSSDEGLNKTTHDAVYFFTPSFHPLDNFSAHAFTLWDREFPTAGHAYQWKKFADTDPNVAEHIRAAKSPHLAKEIADARKEHMPADWHDRKVSVMEEILTAKTEQHEDVRTTLKRTKKKTIIENSPVDTFWGIGTKRNSKNMVGKIWMKIRESL